MKSKRIGQSATKPRTGEGSETIPAGSSESEAAGAERLRYSPSYTERRREIAVKDGDTVFSGNIYSAESSTTTIQGYAQYTTPLYLDDGTESLDTFSEYQGTLVFKTNVPDTIPGYDNPGTVYVLSKNPDADIYKAKSSRTTTRGSEYSYVLYKPNAQGFTASCSSVTDNLYYSGSGVYEIGSSCSYSAKTNYRIRNTNKDKDVTGPNFKLFIKNDNKRTIYKRKQEQYPGDLFYKDDSQTQVKRFTVDRLTFNPATISTQRLTVLTT